MSNTRTHIGTLRLVTLPLNQTVEDWCREKCGGEKREYNRSFEEELIDRFDDEYFIVRGEIYEVVEHTKVGYDTAQINDNKDGTLGFILQFYSGSMSLSECMEDAFDDFKKSKENK